MPSGCRRCWRSGRRPRCGPWSRPPASRRTSSSGSAGCPAPTPSSSRTPTCRSTRPRCWPGWTRPWPSSTASRPPPPPWPRSSASGWRRARHEPLPLGRARGRVPAGPAAAGVLRARRPHRRGDDRPAAVVPGRRLRRRGAAALRRPAATQERRRCPLRRGARPRRRDPGAHPRPVARSFSSRTRPPGVLQDSRTACSTPRAPSTGRAAIHRLGPTPPSGHRARHRRGMTEVPSLRLRRTAVPHFSDDELARLVRRQEWAHLRRGAYVDGPLPTNAAVRPRLLVRATVAALRRPAVVSHQSAAVLHGLPLWGVRLDRVHVTRRPPAWNDASKVLVAHVGRLHDDEVELIDGVAVTDVVRTALDLAR